MPGSLFCCCLGQWPWLQCGWPGGEPLYPVAIMWPWGLMMMAAYCRFVQVENVWASCWQVCNHFWCFCCVFWLVCSSVTIFWSFSVLVCLVVCLICSQFFIGCSLLMVAGRSYIPDSCAISIMRSRAAR